MKKKNFYDYMWAMSCLYLMLGVFNILFAWLGMICFLTPLFISIFGGDKLYCNRYCGRGQLLEVIGDKFGCSMKRDPFSFLRQNWFRYGFLIFFMAMFLLMIYGTYRVFEGASLEEAVMLLWVFKLPWQWTDTAFISPWIAQFAFGFYGIMLTSTLLGSLTMIFFKPRSWCVYCPIGTMTQGICKIKHKNEIKCRQEQNR
ncbi:MAG: 4Fe-4S binding protein [Campylobacteraceae bacterium]|jgi:hypothetical protein|nr:4Fe-4S binding protein [Campylobacteraceae bacterium]